MLQSACCDGVYCLTTVVDDVNPGNALREVVREPIVREPVREPMRETARAQQPPAAEVPFASSADQNLAEMAQRLEAALRRPAGEPMAPPVAPEPPVRPSRSEAPPPPPKSGFENLEDEMASLLGRPKPSS